MLLPLLLLSSALASVSVDSAGPIKSHTSSELALPPVPLDEDLETWRQRLRSYLEVMNMIMYFGAALSTDPDVDAVQLWVTTYQNGGIRGDLSPTQRLWAKSQVIQLQTLAASDPGVLSTELKTAFTNSLANILTELDP